MSGFEWMGRQEYRPMNSEQALGYLVEELGEALAAAGKTLRWGWDSCNPELPEAERERNEDWLMRELDDVAQAIAIIRHYRARVVSHPNASHVPGAFRAVVAALEPLDDELRERIVRAAQRCMLPNPPPQDDKKDTGGAS